MISSFTSWLALFFCRERETLNTKIGFFHCQKISMEPRNRIQIFILRYTDEESERTFMFIVRQITSFHFAMSTVFFCISNCIFSESTAIIIGSINNMFCSNAVRLRKRNFLDFLKTKNSVFLKSRKV